MSDKSDTAKLMKWMNIKHVNEWETKETGNNFSFYKNYRNSYTVEGPFDAVTGLHCPNYNSSDDKTPKETLYKAELSKDCETLTISFNNEVIHKTDMKKIVENLMKKNKANTNNLSVEELTYKESSEKAEISIIIENLSGNIKDKKTSKITNINAVVYFSVKKQIPPLDKPLNVHIN